MSSIVFIIPFAGGGPTSFIKWKTSEIYKKCIFLDFHNSNDHKDLECNYNAYTDYAEEFICNYISTNSVNSYVIWGHSMGSLIAYDVCKRIAKKRFLKPELLILTSTEAPESIDKKKIKELLADEKEFNKYIMDMGLLNRKVINSRFFDEFYKKKLISDYKVLLSYKENEREKIDQRTVAINGKEDRSFLEDNMRRWSEYFTQHPKYKMVEGNHFFIFDKKFDPQILLGEWTN